MTLDLVTTVESIERRPDGHRVEIGVYHDVMLPESIQEIRARARAMIAVGLVDVGEGMGRDIARAIKNMSFSEIDRATTVVSRPSRSGRGGTYEIHVNTE